MIQYVVFKLLKSCASLTTACTHQLIQGHLFVFSLRNIIFQLIFCKFKEIFECTIDRERWSWRTHSILCNNYIKIKFRLKFFNLGWFYLLVPNSWIIRVIWLEDEVNWELTQVKKLCAIYDKMLRPFWIIKQIYHWPQKILHWLEYKRFPD